MQNEDEKDIDNTKKTESRQVSFTQDMAQDIVTNKYRSASLRVDSTD